MRTTIITFLMLSLTCFLPLAISSARPPIIRLPNKAANPTTVLDSDGNPVVTGALYFAKRAPIIGVEGGISVANFNNPTDACPTEVFLNLSIPGENPQAFIRPISFYPLPGATGEIQEDFPVNVAFYEPNPLSNPCDNKLVWKLDDNNMVVTGGVIWGGDVNNWFSIYRYSDDSNAAVNSYIFNNIGTVDGLNRLGINYDSQIPFIFYKVKV